MKARKTGRRLAFVVRTKTGKVDTKKTARLKHKMDKACDKIAEVVSKEISGFQELARSYEVDDSFWIAACHRGMLTLHKDGMELYLSAEFGDLFGSPDLKEPTPANKWLDIERVQKVKEKWDEKQSKKSIKQ